MSTFGGYAGKILKIDLSNRSVTTLPLPRELAANFIGGAGLNIRLAFEHIKPHVEPLSPENALILGAGPLVGTLAPGAGKSNITAKSPLTNLIGTSGSGHMGMLKFAGYDHLIVTGKADSPVYLDIGDTVRIRDASHIWGKDTWETTDALWGELGKRCVVACIGPAGENQVRFANIITNKYSAFGMNGMGAVMGSKNLKAITVYGEQGIRVAEPGRFIQLADRLTQKIMNMESTPAFRDRGTLLALARMGGGYQLVSGNFERALLIDEVLGYWGLDKLDRMTDWHGNLSCLGCPVGCKHTYRLKEGPSAGRNISVSCAFVWLLDFSFRCDLRREGWTGALRCGELANRLGMDSRGGGLIAAAMELFRKGIITKNDTDGLELASNLEVVEVMLEKIALRRGFGDVLADGPVEAARRIGRGAEKFFTHHKGQPNTGVDPRMMRSTFSLCHAVSPYGRGTHLSPVEGLESPARKMQKSFEALGLPKWVVSRIFADAEKYDPAVITKWAEDYSLVLESMGLCLWGHNQIQGIDAWAEVYSAATGMGMDADALLKSAQQSFDLTRAFNTREGASRKDDTLPHRFLNEHIPVGDELWGPLGEEYQEAFKTSYYQERGWDPLAGTVPPERLVKLIGSESFC